VETRGAWAGAWVLGTPPVPTWRLGSASVLGTPPAPTWRLGPAKCWANPCTYVAFGSYQVLGKPLHIRGVWATLGGNHARFPLGDTWRLGHCTGTKGNGSVVKTQDQWVMRKDPILLGPPSRPKVLGS